QWSKIKDKKGANDAQKSILYTKANHVGQLFFLGGGSIDPKTNLHLAAALKKAKDQGVPKENIEKAIAKAGNSREKGGSPVSYEALAFNTVGVIVETVTDNVNRTIHGLREILNSHRARLTPVKFMFRRRGCITFTIQKSINSSEEAFGRHFDELIYLCEENGAEDCSPVQSDEVADLFQIFCEPQDLKKIEELIVSWEKGLTTTIQATEPTSYVAVDPTQVEDDVKEKVEKLKHDLQAYDDSLKVWTTLDTL
ncbi:YebC-like protein, partial [Phlegmacium glaucopus]